MKPRSDKQPWGHMDLHRCGRSSCPGPQQDVRLRHYDGFKWGSISLCASVSLAASEKILEAHISEKATDKGVQGRRDFNELMDTRPELTEWITYAPTLGLQAFSGRGREQGLQRRRGARPWESSAGSRLLCDRRTWAAQRVSGKVNGGEW